MACGSRLHYAYVDDPGAARNFSSPGSGTVVENPSLFLNNQAQFLLTEQLLLQPNDKFAIMPIFMYQRKMATWHPWQQWISFGARPVLFFNKYFSLAFEGGFDHTHSQVAPLYDGWLRNFTMAPQIGAGRKFFSPKSIWNFGLAGRCVVRF